MQFEEPSKVNKYHIARSACPMIPAKRRRGRPRKNDLSKLDANLDIIASAVDQATFDARSSRMPRKVPVGDGNDEIIDTTNGDDEDFIPELDDLVVELDEAENIVKGKKKQKVKRPRTSSSRGNTPGSTLEDKGRVIRALKDLSSARDKIERLYGLNQEKLLNLAKVKEGFETCVFCFPHENIQRDSPYFIDLIPPCASDNVYEQLVGKQRTEKHEIDEIELSQMFKKRIKPLQVVIGEAELSLNVDQKSEFPVLPYGERTGFVYNTGSLITDIAWLKQDDEQCQYLAVSVSQYFDKPSDINLRMLEVEEHVACLEIYKLDPHTLAFNKLQTLVHNFGETWNLKWHEGCRSPGSLGSLIFVCQDGTVKMLDVKMTEEYSIHMTEQPAICVKLPKSMITCFDFMSATRIVCGFKNGFVAEFDLLDPRLPSYYRKIHDSYILTLLVAYSEFENPVVATVAVDGYYYLFDPKDIFTSKTNVTRFRGTNIIPLSYIPQLYAIVNSDGSNTLKTVAPRAAFAVHPVSSQDTSIVSLGTSRIHPLCLSGGSDGNVVIDNIARRLLTGIKNSSLTHTSLRLWKWEYSKVEDKFRLNHAYEPFKSSINEVTGLRIDPHGVNVSCIKWNETSVGGQFYAFANSAGILTVEKLGK